MMQFANIQPGLSCERNEEEGTSFTRPDLSSSINTLPPALRLHHRPQIQVRWNSMCVWAPSLEYPLATGCVLAVKGVVRAGTGVMEVRSAHLPAPPPPKFSNTKQEEGKRGKTIGLVGPRCCCWRDWGAALPPRNRR